MKKLLVALVLSAAGVFASLGETTLDYVQDGLIACWDGYENDGAGGHATSLAEWKDTSGRYSFKFTANSTITVDGNALKFPGNNTTGYATLDATLTAATFQLAKTGTVEIVMQAGLTTAQNAMLQSSSASGIAFGALARSKSTDNAGLVLCNSSRARLLYNWSVGTNTYATTYEGAQSQSTWVNGAAGTMGAGEYFAGAGTETVLGNRNAKNQAFTGKIYAIRLYATKLSAEQIAKNRAVDVQRFVNGNIMTIEGVLASGNPADYQQGGEPQYGYEPLESGTPVVRTAPARIDIPGGRTVVCAGWKLYDYKTDELIAESTDETKLTCSFTYSTPVKLIWQWQQLPIITVKNFDDDLATVYVNDVATTNGQVFTVEDGDEFKIELKDFRSDYYFRYAPASYADRALGFESWDGLPSGVPNENPVAFTPTEDVTIIPNVDVKGYCWQVITNAKGTVTSVTNHYHVWNWKVADDAIRGVDFGKSITNTVGATQNNLEIDFVERVKYKGKNYTITGIPDYHRPALPHTRAGLWALAPRFSKFGEFISAGASTTCITNIVGMYDLKTATIGQYCFYYGETPLKGPATNCVPRRATFIDLAAYNSKSGITGELLLESIVSLNGFPNCTGLTAVRLTSPNLTTIAGGAFSGCSAIKEVTICSSVLSSVGNSCFPSSVTNIIFTGDAPSRAIIDAMLYAYSAKDGAHMVKLTVDPTYSNWWQRVSAPTANEIAAGLPANCMGSYVTENGRKAWIVSSSSTAGVLVVSDMAHAENLGCTTISGLAPDQEITLTAPAGMTIAWLQHLVDGVWTTFETKDLGAATSFTYVHDGMLTRVQWRVDGVTLTLTQSGYAGTLGIEVKSGGLVAGDSVYSKNTVLWITATPQTTTHPYTKFAKWTVDGAKSAETNVVLKVTLDADKTIDCLFGAAEWLYNESTKKATDGFWTTGALVGSIENYGMTFGAFTSTDYKQWLDFSIPVYVPSDPDHQYRIAKVTGPERNFGAYRVRFGAGMEVTSGFGFWSDGVITEIEGLGKAKVTAFNTYFLYNYGTATPLRGQTYEGTDFMPETLTALSSIYAFSESPTIVGTLRFSAMTTMFSSLGGLKCGAVTNLEFLAEGLTAINNLFQGHANIEHLTFGSTNLTSCFSYSFQQSSGKLKDITFLAHAPKVAAIDGILYYNNTTNAVIYCSKYAPGWKAMRMADYKKQPEWEGRPEGTWGIYQTTSGLASLPQKKRYYLVQRDSKYDVRPGFSILVK